MVTNLQTRITLKIFAGVLLNAELRLHLSQSSLWKETKIMGQKNPDYLDETHYQDKDYIGRFFIEDSLTLEELKHVESEIKKIFVTLCPNFPAESLKILFFSQVFIV